MIIPSIRHRRVDAGPTYRREKFELIDSKDDGLGQVVELFDVVFDPDLSSLEDSLRIQDDVSIVYARNHDRYLPIQETTKHLEHFFTDPIYDGRYCQVTQTYIEGKNPHFIRHLDERIDTWPFLIQSVPSVPSVAG